MALSPGARLGGFEIVSLLGAGGMGEVYRARDHKLNRDVALKVVGSQIAQDEGLRRFLREAQTLATLNHPHIAQIYGLEDTTGTHALVMELVEGEDLAATIARGPIAADEALTIARQIADALEAAHEVGVVHRDLKPANVKVRTDGTVKVLDFGLAKAFDPPTGPATPQSPTFTSPAMTAAGVILGTASYMSPEQARGRPVDKRADVWAFGAVLYEMLTGRVCFTGETVTDVLASVVSREPDWTTLPSTVPPRITALLRRCLDKDPRTRLRDIGEARVALAAPAADTASTVTAPPVKVPVWRRPRAIAAIVVAIAAGWLLLRFTQPRIFAPLRKLELALPADGFGFTLSPDGRHIAFRQRGKLMVSDLDRAELRTLAESSMPPRDEVFWSPDSLFVGYSDGEGRLWGVPATGGPPRLICTIPETRQLMGAAWLENSMIAFSVWRGNLYSVPSTGGQPTPLLTIDPKTEIDVHEVVGLPDGRVLAATHLNTLDASTLSYRIEVITPTSRTVAFDAPMQPVARTSDGYLLTRRADVNAGVWAFRDTGRWPLRVEDGVLIAPAASDPSAGNDGSLLYSLASSEEQTRELVWVDRSGHVLGQVGAGQRVLSTPVLSPDGRRVAFATHDALNFDVFVHDLSNNIPSRVTTEADDQVLPSWFPDGRRLVFVEIGRMGNHVVMKNADGTGTRQELGSGSSPSISPDGRHILYTVDEQGFGRLRYSTLSADGTIGPPQKIFNAPEPDVRAARISPDGTLIAYAERLPGSAFEIFITRFPSGDGRWQVSPGGGRAPVWTHTGELLFAAGAGSGGPRHMMVASVKAGQGVSVGSPVTLFPLPEDLDNPSAGPHYDVTGDGQRLLMVRARRTAGQAAVRWVLVQNWPGEFQK